jgi:Zn-dependent M28 family amino/carboxypeptidase
VERGTSTIETGDEGRGWGHTHADTIDKLDVRDLRESAIVLTECVVRVAGEAFDCERVDRRQVADALEAEGQARGLRVTGDWPFDDE